jgi:hypothetical protein
MEYNPIMGTTKRTYPITRELAENYAKRCESLSGSLRALAIVMQEKGTEEAWVLYHHLGVLETVDKLNQRITDTTNRIIEGRPYGSDTVAARPAASRKPSRG